MHRRSFSLALPGIFGFMPRAAASPRSSESNAADQFRKAILESDKALSKFNPLRRILFYDDFDEGINGWTELAGNHNGNLDDLKVGLRDLRPPQLSNCSFFDIGTHGSLNGTYALKLATRPHPFHASVAIKRATYSQPGRVQFEMYFTFKSEQTFGDHTAWDGNVSPSEMNFGDFTVSNDICAGETGPRYMCALRYWNTGLDGKLVQKWAYKTSLETTTKMARAGDPGQAVDFHVHDPHDWADIPSGHQSLCFNEVPTKVNWHYLRWVFDTRTHRNTELQVNELTLDLRNIPVPVYDQGYRALNHLLNFVIDVRTHSAVRNFLFVDSILVSMES